MTGEVGGVLGIDAGEPTRKHASCLHVFGHRTMRQTSSLTALVGRISFEILPPVRAFGAQGGAFGYRKSFASDTLD